jgi:hypothetical protein
MLYKSYRSLSADCFHTGFRDSQVFLIQIHQLHLIVGHLQYVAITTVHVLETFVREISVTMQVPPASLNSRSEPTRRKGS